MKLGQCDIIISAASKKQWPENDVPEIAFAGKSNVGKSSLINMLTNRKKMARTSSRPGKTRIVNFYNIDDRIRFVDLPGYGFAKVSKKEKHKWADMINEYIVERSNLLEIFQLVDMRHAPTEDDVMMYNWIKDMNFSGIVIATKADKVKGSKKQKHINRIRKKLQMDPEAILIPVSSVKRHGKYDVWEIINRILEVHEFDIRFERQNQ